MKQPSPNQAQRLNIVAGYLLANPQHYVDAALITNGYIAGLPKIPLPQAEALMQYIDDYATHWGLFDKKIVDTEACIYLANRHTHGFVLGGGFEMAIRQAKLCQPMTLSSAAAGFTYTATHPIYTLLWQ